MRRLKAIITTVFGFTLLAIGAAMLVLPGPGLVVIAFGLVVLSAEFVWAQRALDRMKDQAQKVRERWGPSTSGNPPGKPSDPL
jgi:putative transmembrane protein PGPGW